MFKRCVQLRSRSWQWNSTVFKLMFHIRDLQVYFPVLHILNNTRGILHSVWNECWCERHIWHRKQCLCVWNGGENAETTTFFVVRTRYLSPKLSLTYMLRHTNARTSSLISSVLLLIATDGSSEAPFTLCRLAATTTHDSRVHAVLDTDVGGLKEV